VAFYNSFKSKVDTATFYNSVALHHGSSDSCIAHNAEVGSMKDFGGPSGSGYSYCRTSGSPCSCKGGSACTAHGSCLPDVPYHIYICRGVKVPSPPPAPSPPPSPAPPPAPPSPPPVTTGVIATGGPYSWGSCGSDYTAFLVKFAAPELASSTKHATFCSALGGNVCGSSHPGDGGSYGKGRIPATVAFYNSFKSKVDTATFYNSVALHHGNSDSCIAHNAEAGSMKDFGGPSGSGYSYCRTSGSPCSCKGGSACSTHGGCLPDVPYHIYLCK
jgi:hypothetical protein